MEQAFDLVNSLLAKDEGGRRRNLRIRTYKVVPLQNRNGLLEFVRNTVPLGSILASLYECVDFLDGGSGAALCFSKLTLPPLFQQTRPEPTEEGSRLAPSDRAAVQVIVRPPSPAQGRDLPQNPQGHASALPSSLLDEAQSPGALVRHATQLLSQRRDDLDHRSCGRSRRSSRLKHSHGRSTRRARPHRLGYRVRSGAHFHLLSCNLCLGYYRERPAL